MLFHVSATSWSRGDVIQPGAWGSKMRQVRDGGVHINHSAIVFAWELALESTRRQVAADKPSRLDAVFACASIETARAFRDRYRNSAAIYSCEPAADPPLHHGSFDLLATGPVPYIDAMVTNSLQYWTMPPRGLVEIVVGGPMVIIDLVDPAGTAQP